jgi:hypothetical protein
MHNQYSDLFICIMNELHILYMIFYDLELCTMYDSHDVYLLVIFAYTNLVDVIIFHGFFVLFTDF